MARATTNTASTINLLAGIWLIISPFILNYSGLGVSATNSVILGIIIGILAIIRMSTPNSAWASWINFLLGLWMIIAPFSLGHGAVSAVVTNSVILGIIVAVFGLTSALTSNRTMQTMT
ncbi:MAG TPA: SPW repeat protein [Patescibacteria group bacterium]|nr:SPW repeat protein [Patescibacteria group bacterium]